MAQQYYTGSEWLPIPQNNVLTISDTEINTNGVRIREADAGCYSTPQVQNIPVNLFNTDTQSIMSCSDVTTAFSGAGLTFDGTDYATTGALETAVQAFYPSSTLAYDGTSCKFDFTIGPIPLRIEVSNVIATASLAADFSNALFSQTAVNQTLTNTMNADNGSGVDLSGSATIQLTVNYGANSCVVEYSQGSTLGSGSATRISGNSTLYTSFVNNTSSSTVLNAANLNTGGVDITVNKMEVANDMGLQGVGAVDMTITIQAIDGALVSNTGVSNATSTLEVYSRGCFDNTTEDLTEISITDGTYGNGYRYNPFDDIGGIFEVFPPGGTWSSSVTADGFFVLSDSNSKYDLNDSCTFWHNHEVRVVSYTTKDGSTVTGPFAANDMLTSPRGRLRLPLSNAGQNMPFNAASDLPGTAGVAGVGYTEAVTPSSGDYRGDIYRRDDTGGLDDILFDDMMETVILEFTTGTNIGTIIKLKVGDAFTYRY